MHLLEDMKLQGQLANEDKDLSITGKSKTSILEKLNNKVLVQKISSKSTIDDTSRTETSTPPEDFDVNALIDALIKLHRQHLRDATDSGKNESKLLVNFTMKRSTSDRVNVTSEVYLQELEDFMDHKLSSIKEIKARIDQIRSSQ
jgi:hypothetical protein